MVYDPKVLNEVLGPEQEYEVVTNFPSKCTSNESVDE